MSSASLPEPLAEGDLERTPFAHLLLHVRERALTGTLVVWDPSGAAGRQQDRIRFSKGQPVAGRLLARASRLDRGMLPLFARTEGPFAFYEGVDLVGETEHVRTGSIGVRALVAASLRGSSRDDAVEHVLAGFGDAPLRLVQGADLASLNLLPEEQTCVELIRAEPVSAARLAQISPLPERTVRRLVYLLAITKLVDAWDGVSPARRSAPAQSAPARPKSAPPAAASERPRAAAKPEGGVDRDTAEAPPPPPDRLSDRHRALWEEICERSAQIESQNYYDMLGVARDASSDAIETAYYGQVKKWHPDRIPPELIELRPIVEGVFQYLTRAQETLTDEEKRGPYLQTVQAGGGTPESERQLGQIIQAAMDFRKVEILMKRRDWKGARAILDEILALSPDEADYYATRADILHHLSASEGSLQADILADLDRALGLAENHDKAHYLKGVVLKQAGKADEAIVHFKRAAELNPRNIEAAREVRLAEMRSGATDDGKAGGGDSFFGKFFGKKK